MNTLWKPLVHIIEKYTSTNKIHTMESICKLQKDLFPLLSKYYFKKVNDIPYGRYLIHQDDKNLFNIQIDVFSFNYSGKIHCHNTWGILHVFNGFLFVEDWNKTKEESFILRGGLILKDGSSQSFCPPISDWHKVSTGESLHQTISMHIYGNDFNLDKGIYLDDDLEQIEGNRSEFKDIETINKIVQCY